MNVFIDISYPIAPSNPDSISEESSILEKKVEVKSEKKNPPKTHGKK